VNDLPQLRHQFVRRSYQSVSVFNIVLTVETHDDAASLAHYQCASSYVPWLEANFEKAVQAACSNPSKVKAGSARATEVFNFFEYGLEDTAIRFQMLALAKWKCRREDRSLEVNATGYAESFVVKESATTAAGGEQFIAHWIVYHAVFGSAVYLLRNRNCKVGIAMQVVAGTIQRIDDPDNIPFTGGSTFFAQKGVVREVALNFPYNLGLAHAVNFCDIVMSGFTQYGYALHLEKMAAHDFARCMGSTNRYVYD
jgi:hypothetical protein